MITVDREQRQGAKWVNLIRKGIRSTYARNAVS